MLTYSFLANTFFASLSNTMLTLPPLYAILQSLNQLLNPPLNLFHGARRVYGAD
jgi:hypothetical protein